MFWGLGRRPERCPLDDPGLTSGTWIAGVSRLPAGSPAVWESVPGLGGIWASRLGLALAPRGVTLDQPHRQGWRSPRAGAPRQSGKTLSAADEEGYSGRPVKVETNYR